MLAPSGGKCCKSEKTLKTLKKIEEKKQEEDDDDEEEEEEEVVGQNMEVR